ncbi:MAG: hypothetical protein GX801_06905 [Fibrobacter sp.]|nr:hypothetical protein [Fibrobacter sp.]
MRYFKCTFALLFALLLWACSDFYSAGVSHGSMVKADTIIDTVKVYFDTIEIKPQFTINDTLLNNSFEIRPKMTAVIATQSKKDKSVETMVFQGVVHSSTPLSVIINSEHNASIVADSANDLWVYEIQSPYTIGDEIEVQLYSHRGKNASVEMLALFSYEHPSDSSQNLTQELLVSQYADLSNFPTLEANTIAWRSINVLPGDSILGNVTHDSMAETWFLDSLNFSKLIEFGKEPEDFIYNSKSNGQPLQLYFKKKQTIGYAVKNLSDSVYVVENDLKLIAELKLED